MYQALYRKYRPKNFDEVVGQEVIVKTLKNSIKNNMVSHAYLLAGPRGTGKTSIAKIFAKILNCQNLKENFQPCNECISCTQANSNQNIDIIEIDAASNNGVDEIREIRNKITLVPTNSKYKIYIIDEVHMLTTQAFNALLKTLEEPPEHIIFIFATTEPHKIPRTILSRCQRFDYKKVSNVDIVKRLKFICESEKINITEEALYEIAKLSDGGMRDSISLLDQALAYSDNEITIDDIHSINGTLSKDEIENFIIELLNKNLVEVIKKIEQYDLDGKNIVKITKELIEELKNCIIYINAPSLIESNTEFYEKVKEINNTKDIYIHIKKLSSLINEMKSVSDSKILLEIEFIKNVDNSSDYQEVITTPLQSQSVKKENFTNVTQKNIDECAKVIELPEKEVKPKVDTENLEKLKKIRIGNSLCQFSQKSREKVKKELEKINDYLSDSKFSKYASILKDGELKAASNEYLMFMYKQELVEKSFNLQLNEIENFIEEILNKKYKVIAINLDEWDFLKKDYNENRENYKFIDEGDLLNDISTEDKNEKITKTNSIDEMFDDIIVYE